MANVRLRRSRSIWQGDLGGLFSYIVGLGFQAAGKQALMAPPDLVYLWPEYGSGKDYDFNIVLILYERL